MKSSADERKERKAGLGNDIGMLAAASVLCSAAYHLGRAIVTGYPVSFISPYPSDMIGVALFLVMLAPVAIPRYYYCRIALLELNEWYRSPEGQKRKHRWVNEQNSELCALVAFFVLVVSPLVELRFAPDQTSLFGHEICLPVILYCLLLTLYWAIALLLRRNLPKKSGDSGQQELLGMITALLLAAAAAHLLVILFFFVSAAYTATTACIVAPTAMLVFESIASLFKRRHDGVAPGESLRFIAAEGAKLIRDEFVPVIIAVMIGALLLGTGFILPWSELKLKFTDNGAEKLENAEVIDMYGGDRAIIRKKNQKGDYIYGQINLSDGYWVTAAD